MCIVMRFIYLEYWTYKLTRSKLTRSISLHDKDICICPPLLRSDQGLGMIRGGNHYNVRPRAGDPSQRRLEHGRLAQ